jgi:hypothetical protein
VTCGGLYLYSSYHLMNVNVCLFFIKTTRLALCLKKNNINLILIQQGAASASTQPSPKGRS